MVQALKYKSLIITPDKAEVIDKFHGTMLRKDLAHKIGVNESTLKYFLKVNGYHLYRKCRKEIPFMDQKVSIVISGIPRSNYSEALKAALKAVEQFKTKKSK